MYLTFFNFCKNSLPDSRDRACAHVPSMAIIVVGSEQWPVAVGILSMLTAGEWEGREGCTENQGGGGGREREERTHDIRACDRVISTLVWPRVTLSL